MAKEKRAEEKITGKSGADIFKGKDILVTGGCGSIGLEIVRQLLKHDPLRVRVFDHDESGHFRINQEIKSDKIRNLIGSVTDKDRINRAMQGVDIVFHAAALKHVPFCEYNPFEAVHTNVVGTQNVVDAAINNNVKILVGISTDKAVNPINTMGATKLLGEKIITNAPSGFSTCKFCCVRFGNVLNSVGSVIPIFKKQIADGGPVTVTSDKMTRFFMSMDEAVSLVLKTAEITRGGETFILKMNALKVIDLAQVMIEEMAPRCNRDPKKMKIEIIGVRPGEKIDEGLMTKEEADYMIETKDMLVLYNSILCNYGKGIIPADRKQSNHLDYNSGNIPLLSKEDIRKKLYEKKII
ncbi:MAG: polysaccharide biosynthesis protein [archaeon]